MIRERGEGMYDSFSDLYDRFMKDADYEKWADILEDQFCSCSFPVKKIVDVGCGTGSISVLLAKRGYTVIGIDSSEGMLREAEKKARKEGVKVIFSHQKAEELEIGRADAVIMCCDVVNYIAPEDLTKVFMNIRKSLKKGALLIFDISSEHKLRDVLADAVFYEDYDDCSYFWRNTLNEKEKCVDMELTFFIRKGELYERKDEYQKQFIHTADTMKEKLSLSGFVPVCIEFGKDKAPSPDAERLLFVGTAE